MDALALLCTLHADGPSTLKNLRQAGCESLQAIESMEEERLSKVLGGPPAVARRFAREARQLRERLDPMLLEREEPHAEPSAEAVEPEAPTGSQRDPMADVLEAWRDRDASEVPASAAPSSVEAVETHEDEVPPRPVRARPEFEFSSDIVAAMRDLATDIVPEKGQARSPDAAALEGLFEGQALELAVRLGEEGIADLRALTDQDVLDLSKRLGFGYTRILRVVQLARLAAPAVAETPVAVAEPPPTPKLSPADRPRPQGPSILELEWNLEIQPQAPPQREDAGGPFA